MKSTDLLKNKINAKPEDIADERERELFLTYQNLPLQEVYLLLQDRLFVPAQKSVINQIAEFEVPIIDLRFNKLFSPTAIARRSYLFLQILSDAIFGPDYYTRRENLHSYLLAKTTFGSGVLTYLGKTYELRPGDIILLDCRRHHEYHAISPEGWGYILAHFDGIAMEDYYNQILAGGNVRFRFTEGSVFDTLLRQLFDINQSYTPNCEMLTNCLLIQMMTEIMKTLPQFGSDVIPKRIQDICVWLTEHCCDKISLDDIAAAFNMSKFYISREFKRYIGITIFDYLHDERYKIAKGMLCYTDMSIAAITEYIGYENQSAFCRLFRHKEGLTAMEYRKQWKNT
jgi:AraC-like DNA-binding protein